MRAARERTRDEGVVNQMIVFLCIVGVVGYAAIGGATCCFVWRKYPPRPYGGEGGVLAGIFWPVGLTLISSYALMSRAMDCADERRKAAAKEAAELKALVAELEKEMRAGKAK
jgi:hypothetical protein